MSGGIIGEEVREIMERAKRLMKKERPLPQPSPEAQKALDRLYVFASQAKPTMAVLEQEHCRALIEYINALKAR